MIAIGRRPGRQAARSLQAATGYSGERGMGSAGPEREDDQAPSQPPPEPVSRVQVQAATQP